MHTAICPVNRHRSPSSRAGPDLFRRGVIRRQRTPAQTGELSLCSRLFGLDKFCNPKVEQLDLTLCGDQDVGRLQIPVNDEMGVCVRNCVTHLQEKAQSRGNIEALFVTPLIDGLALDVFEDEIQDAHRCRPGIEETSDVRMRKLAEDLAFTNETLACSGLRDMRVQNFEGDGAFEPPVNAASEPNLPHPAETDLLFELICAKTSACLEGRLWNARSDASVLCRATSEEFTGLRGAIRAQKREDMRVQIGPCCSAADRASSWSRFCGPSASAVLETGKCFAPDLRGRLCEVHQSAPGRMTVYRNARAFLPVALDGRGRSVQNFRDLFYGQAGEISHLDDLVSACIDPGQLLKCSVERLDFWRG